MAGPFTHINLEQLEDLAAKYGYGELAEARFAYQDLESDQVGLSIHHIKPNKRQGFAHRHEEVEEVYVVISGSGRVKLDDEIVELKPRDALRVSPNVVRQFEAGPEGLEFIACSPRRPDDRGEQLTEWWTD